MKTNPPDSLVNALKKVGLQWSDLYQTAEQIILFGSRAVGVARSDSDWDLLLIGPGRTKRLGIVDLIWVKKTKLYSKEWLGGELAGHVAAYGHWLKGDDSWKANVHSSQAALKRKRKKIAARLKSLEMNWPVMLEPYRRKHFEVIRRDLQRFRIMSQKEAMIPTPMLDSMWRSSKSKRNEFLQLARDCRVLSSFVRAKLANYAEKESEKLQAIRSTKKNMVGF